MRQYKHRDVIGWVVTPPPLPVQVGPGTANRSEHVPPENPGTDALEPACREVVIRTRRAIAGAMGPLEGASRNKPVMQVHPADPERVVDVLSRPSSVAVKRDGEALHPDTRHFHTSTCFDC